MQLSVQNFGFISKLSLKMESVLFLTGQIENTCIAKLIAIFSDYLCTKTQFLGMLKHFNIDFYLNEQTYLHYQDEYSWYRYENGEFFTEAPQNWGEVVQKELNLTAAFAKVGRKNSEDTCIYIPAQRAVLSSLSPSLYQVLEADMDFPKYQLVFANRYQNALSDCSFHFDFLDKVSDTKAFQAGFSLAVLLTYYSKNPETLFIIEQPELHLVPKVQKNLFRFLIEKVLKSENQLLIISNSSYFVPSQVRKFDF